MRSLLREDITALGSQLAELLAGTDGQILTTLPGVAVVRAGERNGDPLAAQLVWPRRCPANANRGTTS
jgi:hypothetical protein